MKKVIFALIFLLGITSEASAQIIQSTASKITVIKEVTPPTQSWWTIKLGGGLTGPYSDGAYNVNIGYSKYLRNSSLYWNVNVGSSMLYSDTYNGVSNNPTIYLGPAIGIKKAIAKNSNIMFDGHFGVSVEYAFNDYDNLIGISPELGIDLWFNRFLIEADYHPGIIDGDFVNRFLLNLGWRF